MHRLMLTPQAAADLCGMSQDEIRMARRSFAIWDSSIECNLIQYLPKKHVTPKGGGW